MHFTFTKLPSYLIFFFFPLIGLSQDCQELFLSEIIFGQNGSTAGESNSLNHSVEIFNPTEQVFILDEYQIVLISSTDNEDVSIQLAGQTEPGEVFIVSNNTANEDIITETDLLSPALNFEDKAEIRLLKNGIIIDKLGNAGQNINNEPIDLDLLLNDPEYLNSLEINLGSIENLSIRKQALVQDGNPNFQNIDFLSQWSLYPGFVFANLGQHQCSCSEPVIFWKKIDGSSVDKFFYEESLDETRGEDRNFIPPPPSEVYGEGIVCLSSALPVDLNFTIFNHGHEYINPLDPPATDEIDWDVIDISKDFVMKAGKTEYKFPELSYPIVDMEEENTEGYGFSVKAVYDGKLIHDPNRFVIDFQIYDPFNNTKELHLIQKQLKVFPTIAEDHINIENNSNNVVIESVHLVDLIGRLRRSWNFEKISHKNITLELNGISGQGYHVIVIQTNKGLVSKKFYKK